MATTFAAKTMTPKQSAYIASLLETRETPSGLAAMYRDGITAAKASQIIDKLTKCPWKNSKGQTVVKPTEIVGEGFYCLGDGAFDNLVYYKVQTSKSTGKRYALRWNGKSWDFASGAIYKLTATDKLSKDQAVKFGKKTGKCCICSKVLTVKASVEAGIGPVCAEKLGW